MIPELGHIALIIAFGLAILMALIPLAGSYLNNVLWMSSARSLAAGLFVFVLFAYGCLTWAFMDNDFSVAYVAHGSNSFLPWYYKFCAVWGGHEGSLLLWILMLAGWTFAVSVLSKTLPLAMVARVLSILGMVSCGFLSFTLLTSNPFDRLLPNTPLEGGDLNPLLQDPAFIFHPPMLYMGYVGFSVAFAFALAALLSGRLDSAWARWSRPWTTAAWSFLTLGVALGSWWAYYELGWGGWWFWDPTENASLMPWLAGTALMHSLAVTEKRGIFKSWTILLAIFAFSLSLLGTFLVRSGVVTSVHAFASDPGRGLFILFFLAAVIGGSLLVYALKAPTIRSSASFSLLSRELFLLLNNVLLIIILFVVLLGTLYPLMADAFGWGRLSVGPPFFNLFFVPLALLLSSLVGVGSISNWKQTRAQRYRQYLSLPLLLSLALAAAFPWIAGQAYEPMALVVVFVGSWVVISSVNDWYRKSISANAGLLAGLRRLKPSFYAMVIAHIGLGLAVIGGGLSTIYAEQKDVRLVPGEEIKLAAYRIHFVGAKSIRGPNYQAEQGLIKIYSGEKLISELKPEKRRYFSGGSMMTEAAVDSNLWRDIYIAMGEPLDDGAWAVRIYIKPFVAWLWYGAIFMGLGGFIAVADKRYRKTNTAAAVADPQLAAA